MSNVSSPRDRAARVELPQGGFTHRTVAPRVAEYKVWGHFDVELADRLLAVIERDVARETRCVAFHDWSEMEDYETRARLRLTSWVIKNRQRYDAIHILSSSRLVGMGVTVANLSLGQFITTYNTDQRGAFAGAMAEVVRAASPPRSSVLPSSPSGSSSSSRTGPPPPVETRNPITGSMRAVPRTGSKS
jgi:hypothetical protein